jgi:hypothetical protein
MQQPTYISLNDLHPQKRVSSDIEASLFGFLGSAELPKPLAVFEGPIADIYEVSSDVGIYYLTKDRKFLINGDIIDVDREVNLTTLSQKIVDLESSLSLSVSAPNKDIVISSPKEEPLSQVSEQAIVNKTVEEGDPKDAHLALIDRKIAERGASISVADKAETIHHKAVVEPKASHEHSKANFTSEKTPADPEQQAKSDGVAITSGEGFVIFGDQRVPKVGYNIDGARMSPDETAHQISQLYSRAKIRGDGWSVTYPATNETHEVIVFSDPTCGYCKRLHKAIPEINEAGISVTYLMYPRALALGIEHKSARRISATFKKAWCSEDKEAAFDKIYLGGLLASPDCSKLSEWGRKEFPMVEHYFIGQLLDVQGTPSTILPNGKRISGFPGAKRYIKAVKDLLSEDSQSYADKKVK